MPLDLAKLDEWLDDRMPGKGQPLDMVPYAQASNEILKVTRGSHVWILRKPPAVALSATAHNMAREFRLLSALEGSRIPHPSALAFCDDVDVLGVPFLLLELVDGFTPELPLPQPFATDPAQRRAMAFEFIDAFAEIERFDWRAHGLEGFGKPEGFLDRQVDRWLGQLASYDTRKIAGIHEVAEWLRVNKPEMGSPSLIHGDYQFRNVMFANGAPARLAAVIDWELATIGDPLVDLGYLLIRWFEAGEQAPEAPPGTPLLTALPGMPTRDELANRYAERTGRSLDNLPYYQTLAQFKLAIIMEARRGRALAAGSEIDDTYRPGLLAIETMVDNMVRRAADIAGVAY